MILRRYLHLVDKKIYLKQKRKLTAKQKTFIFCLNLGSNATLAARNAGYSRKNARQAARQLLKSPYVLVGIQKEIRRCIKEHGEAISPFWLLSVKHRHFCLNYISSYYLNVTEAAIKTGYNKRNARRIGSRLYKNKAIQAGIRDLEDYMHKKEWNHEDTHFL
nr:MAG TPA: terminase small subunit [Caudoviricetes sp.]